MKLRNQKSVHLVIFGLLFTYRGLWGMGGPRVTHPECIVARIRKKWPGDFEAREYRLGQNIAANIEEVTDDEISDEEESTCSGSYPENF